MNPMYDKECAQFSLSSGYELYLCKDVEIIGNIYQNPELLEKEKKNIKK